MSCYIWGKTNARIVQLAHLHKQPGEGIIRIEITALDQSIFRAPFRGSIHENVFGKFDKSDTDRLTTSRCTRTHTRAFVALFSLYCRVHQLSLSRSINDSRIFLSFAISCRVMYARRLMGPPFRPGMICRGFGEPLFLNDIMIVSAKGNPSVSCRYILYSARKAEQAKFAECMKHGKSRAARAKICRSVYNTFKKFG